MTRILSFIKNKTDILFNLSRSRLSFAKKIRIAFWYSYIFIKKNMPGMLRFKKTRFLGYTAESFDCKTLFFLFVEIFVNNQYYFKSDTDEPTIIDCGANIGMATLYFSFLYPAAHIYSFEPDPGTYALLKKNIEANGLKGATPLNFAVSDKSGTVDFFNNNQDGSPVMSTHRERGGDKKIQVRSIKLSDFIRDTCEKVDYLKMDVEGSEGVVLEDLSQSGILGRIESMVIEYHHNTGQKNNSMSKICDILDSSHFSYNIFNTNNKKDMYENSYQDIMIYAQKINRI